MITPLCRSSAFLAAVALVCASARSQPPLPPPDKAEPKTEKPPEKPAEEPGVKVLEQGPVHEAFAQPGADVRGKGMTAPKAPPEPIPEVPPDAKPDGADVKWVPGYWMWDAERKDFIWMSGFWRNVPPGREWQPGKWTAAKDGTYVYTPGFWRPADMNSWRIDLPEPPATVEAGPNTPPDDPDAVWLPGAWEFRNEKYVWRPGYWARPAGDLLWTPGQYLTTTHGFTHVPGYWDYPLEDRGLLYAPVCFTRPLWRTPGWAYRPRFAVGVGYGTGWGSSGFFGSLYIGPGYNNYYFGNYGRPWAGGTWLGLSFGSPFWGPAFGFGGPALGPYPYANYIPWWVAHKGYPNPLWRHYCWLNRANPAYPKHVAGAYVGKAFGVPHPGHHHAKPVAAQPAAVGGALNTAVRSAATAAVRPAPPQAAPLVQPAAQVANSLATAKAARAANNPKALSVAPPNGTAGLGKAPPVNQPAVSAAPGKAPVVNQPAAKLPANPVHSGAKGNPVANAGNKIDVKPPTVVPGVPRQNLPDVRVPQAVEPNPGGQPLVKSGNGGNPGATVVPKNPVQVAPANPGPVAKGPADPPPIVGSKPGPMANPKAVGNPNPKPPPVNANPPVVRSNPAPAAKAPAISLPPPQMAPAAKLPAQSLPVIRPPAQTPAARLPAQSLPAIRPPAQAPPVVRAAPAGGGARGLPAAPAGGARGGGGGGARGGGGGGKGGKR